MKCAVGNQPASSRTPEGPIAPHIGSFAEFLSAQGYALSSIRRQVQLAVCFSRWLKQERVELCRITSDHSRQYLRYRARQVKPCLGDPAVLKHLLEFLRGEEVIPAEPVSVPQLTPVEHYTAAYAQHLREEQGLAEATIRNYVPFIDCFLKGRFADGPQTGSPDNTLSLAQIGTEGLILRVRLENDVSRGNIS